MSPGRFSALQPVSGQAWGLQLPADAAAFRRLPFVMKLTRKLTLVIALGVFVILFIAGYVRIQREIVLFESDMRRDHQTMGTALASAMSEVWRLKGQAVALDVIGHVNVPGSSVHVRWLKSAPGLHPGPNSFEDFHRAVSGILGHSDGRFEYFYTYVPVGSADYGPGGVLEISESLEQQRAYLRNTLVGSIMTTLGVGLVCTLLAYGFGAWIVGRPIQLLAAKAQRVGSGDLSGPVVLAQRDELGQLADEMNAMCDRLRHAQARIASETDARIRTLDQLRHADRLCTVGKLASGIAHELGTPLNVVFGRARMVELGEVDNEDARECARIIGAQTQRMSKIIRQLMDFARRRGLHRELRDLRDIVRQTLALIRPLGEQRSVQLRFDESSVPVLIEVAESEIQQVLSNLVMNAIQASPAGTEVVVRLEHRVAKSAVENDSTERPYVCVLVHDHGVGMSEEVAAHAFEPFFTTKDVGEGTGLGLSVAHGIVTDHGGFIDIETKPGMGSTFTVYLPEQQAA